MIKQDACIKCYVASKPLYLKTDASGFGLGSSLLQVRDGINCRQDKVSHNTAFFPTAFAGKSLPSLERQFSNIE